jgi:hypothetical protein
MRYFKHKTISNKINIYPIVCWHVGAKQSSIKFIEKVVKEIQEDPYAAVIYMGDAGECVTKFSKGNIYEQTLSPGDQLRVAAELMGPIKDKMLFGIRGNHGNRIDRETGVGWDEMLCARVGIPYLGVSALSNIDLFLNRTHTASLVVYTHHGSASAIGPGGKMTAGHKPEQLVEADIALTAHTHACGEAWPPRHIAKVDHRKSRIDYSTMRMFVCGSAYDSRDGYAEEKMYPVLLPQHIVVQVEAKWDGKAINLNITHRTIDGFSDEFASQESMNKWYGRGV